MRPSGTPWVARRTLGDVKEPYTGDGPARKFRDTILFTPVKRGEGEPGTTGDETPAAGGSRGVLVVVAVAVVVVLVVVLLGLLA